ncbi:DUF805 domain-containing protein [Plantibacter flavus]|uniref:DUF805 domain-containing protein n=1 Tax=Plantibacter flavus TaxID=150123 RepID=UPI003F14CF51
MTESASSPRKPIDDRPLYAATPWQAVARFWKRYFLFLGRASGSEFWWWFLANAVVVTTIAVVGRSIDASVAGPGWTGFWSGDITDGAPGSVQNIALGVWGLATLIPGLALAARRLHDINSSGWWQLVALIPIAGTIWFLILCASPSDPRGVRFDAASQPSATGGSAEVVRSDTSEP